MIDFDAIKSKVSIKDVLEHYSVSLDKKDRCACPIPSHGHDGNRRDSFHSFSEHQRWHCFSKKTSGDVIDLEKEIGKHPDLASAARALCERHGIGPSANGHPSRPIDTKPVWKTICAYDYLDEGSNLLFQVVRQQDITSHRKSFFQRRPNGNGGWVSGKGCMDGVRNVLFHLPEIVANPLEVIAWVVEGEKDVERLAALGFLATCNPMGAGKWLPEHTETLKGRPVVVVEDKDDEGRRHARKVARSLVGSLATMAKDVRVIEVPRGKDVTEFFELGGTAEELEAIALAAPEWTPTAEPGPDTSADGTPPEGYGVWASDIKEEEYTWLMDGYIPRGGITVFAGMGGVGKTLALCDLAARVSAGLVYFNGTTSRFHVGRTLFISGEDSTSKTIIPRMRVHGADLSKIRLLDQDGLEKFLIGDTCVEFLENELELMGGADLIVIDPPSAFLGTLRGKTVDSCSEAEVRKILAPLHRLAEKWDLALLLNTHVNKGSGQKLDAQLRVLNSVAWVNAPRASFMFAKDPDDQDKRIFAPLKVNLAAEPPSRSYRINNEGAYPKIDWGGIVVITANEALNGKPEKNAAKDATDWLITRFKEKTRWPSHELTEKAKQELGETIYRTLARAKNELDIQSQRDGKAWVSFVSEDWIYWH